MSLFRYEPAEDESVDPQYVLISNPNITIQDATAYGLGWCVNEWIEEPDPCSKPHGIFKTLEAAKAAALAVVPTVPRTS